MALIAVAVVAGLMYYRSHAGTVPQVGFNWPSAGRVYVAHWDQQSVLASDPARPFRVAKANGMHEMRIFLGDDVVIGQWQSNPQLALNDMQRMFDDATANGVKLVVSTYLTQATVEKLAGHTYATWADAQRDLMTAGSTPYVGLTNWNQAVVTRFANHPGVLSWEVTNEPSWMLGIDNGSVSRDAGYQFLDHFQALLHTYGAKIVNGGGGPLYDPALLTDAQIKTYAAHLDILDNHIYPALDGAGKPVGDAASAQQLINQTNTFYQRARMLTARPDMPGMLGEFGTLPPPWFQTIASESVGHGWMTLAWGFDAYDQNIFSDTTRPEVVAYLTSLLGAGPTPTPSPSPSASPTPTATPAPPSPREGDINADGKVNVFDLSLLLSSWGNSGGAADLDKNGAVDVFDLSRLLSKWTG